MSIETILKMTQKTNPKMTKDKLIEELSKSRYSAIALVAACENNGEVLQNQKSMVY